jgi:hypothetical protein
LRRSWVSRSSCWESCEEDDFFTTGAAFTTVGVILFGVTETVLTDEDGRDQDESTTEVHVCICCQEDWTIVSFPSVVGNKRFSKVSIQEELVQEKTFQDHTVSSGANQARNPERYADEAKTPAVIHHVLIVQDWFFISNVVPVWREVIVHVWEVMRENIFHDHKKYQEGFLPEQEDDQLPADWYHDR